MFGWISKRQHRREITRARENYRWEADQKMAEAERIKREYTQKLEALVCAQTVEDFNIYGRRVRIVLDIDPWLIKTPPDWRPDWEWVARKIIADLTRIQHDFRPDMRRAMPEGIGGPELPSRRPL